MSDIIIPELTSFEWVKTCEACPVQFDLYNSKGIKVAYFRFRGGILSVNNYNGEEIGDDVIYLDEHTYNGSYLSQKELDKIIPIVEQKVHEYLISNRFLKVCPICNTSFTPDIEHRKACSKCLGQADMENVRQMIQTLDDLGWSELIDPRWEDKVIQDLKTYYQKDIPIIDMYKLLEIVLW